MSRILLTGASGLIGSRLIAALEARGDEVVQLVRSEPTDNHQFQWDPYAGTIDDRALKGLDAVINLSGAGIGDRRWTDRYRRTLVDSRIVTTRFLAEQLADLGEKPTVFVSQSATGIYGDRGDELLTEESSTSTDDFLAKLTVDWEAAANPAREAGIRVIHPRTGIVIDRESQLVKKLLPLFRLGVGGQLGDGQQWWGWITLDDVVGAMLHLLDSNLEGPVNLTAPAPVRNKEFTRALAKQVRRPAILPVPAFALRMVLGGEKADAIGLSGARVLPVQLIEDGYRFTDPAIEPALARLLG